MTTPRRRALPDNLDPLVDTLSNVVGILVIVIALTQLELGDALARVAAGGAANSTTEAPAAPQGSAASDASASESALIGGRLEALRKRSGSDLARTGEVLRRALGDLGAAEPVLVSEPVSAPRSGAAAIRDREMLETRVARAREALAHARTSQSGRRAHADTLERVPRRLVARLPDPEVVDGKESWILVRHGRVYLVDREALFDTGRQAIRRIVPDGPSRALRPDEFESVARYLRKTEIGHGAHRWKLITEPAVRLVLEWRTRDGGIERSQIADDPEFGRWLARRDPDLDTIRFQVWTDSFETYLEARARIEAAGFRGGWRGREADEELEVTIRFGLPDPEVRPLEVD